MFLDRRKLLGLISAGSMVSTASLLGIVREDKQEGISGPFKRERFRHAIQVSYLGKNCFSDEEARVLHFEWACSHGFIPENIRFVDEYFGTKTQDKSICMDFTTRYVGRWSEWYVHMSDPLREEWVKGL